jgi:hypothetical protein
MAAAHTLMAAAPTVEAPVLHSVVSILAVLMEGVRMDMAIGSITSIAVVLGAGVVVG